jgi:AAA15 family ATPase/GTPase
MLEVTPSGSSLYTTVDGLPPFLSAVHGVPLPEVRTTHQVLDQNGHALNVQTFSLDEQESEGTKKLFGLAGLLVHALEAGLVAVVDELDARLHPLITQAIIDLFHDPQANPRNAQLVFTTHDTNLLRNTIFRRDQIWFVEKDRLGASHLYSLAEFKVRNDASFDKDYIHGRYGVRLC